MTTRRNFLSFVVAAAGMAAVPLLRPRKPTVCVCTVSAVITVKPGVYDETVFREMQQRFHEALQRDPWHIPVIQHGAIEQWTVMEGPVCPLHSKPPIKMINIKADEVIIA